MLILILIYSTDNLFSETYIYVQYAIYNKVYILYYYN